MNNTVRFRTLEWKFRETSLNYPELQELPKKKITSPQEFYDLFKPIFIEAAVEIFLVAWLSSSNQDNRLREGIPGDIKCICC